MSALFFLLPFLTASLSMAMINNSFSAGWDHLLVISKENEILICEREVAVERAARTSLTRSFKAIQFFKDKYVTSVAAGHRFSLMLCDDGSVYSLGENYSGQLGYDTKKKAQLTPRIIEDLPKNIIEVSASEYYSLALSDKGQVLSWGDSKGVQEVLGLKEFTIKKIATAGSFTGCFALDDKGILWAFALDPSRYLPWKGTKEKPFEVNSQGALKNKVVRNFEAGGEHALILTTDNLVMVYGRYNYDYCPGKYLQSKEVIELRGKKVIKIAAGQMFSAVLTNKGDIWWFGLGNLENENYGSYNVPEAYDIHDSPKKIDIQNLDVTDIKSGSCSRALFLYCKNENTFIRLGGNGDSLGPYFPKTIHNIRVILWSKENFRHYSQKTKNIIFYMMCLQKYHIDLKLPKVILYLIFDLLIR